MNYKLISEAAPKHLVKTSGTEASKSDKHLDPTIAKLKAQQVANTNAAKLAQAKKNAKRPPLETGADTEAPKANIPKIKSVKNPVYDTTVGAKEFKKQFPNGAPKDRNPTLRREGPAVQDAKPSPVKFDRMKYRNTVSGNTKAGSVMKYAHDVMKNKGKK